MKETNSPLVSVVIAFLNEEHFLAQAIESVLQQDYELWEILLVDDGSTDHSTGIAQQYAKQLPDKILYCEHEGHSNRGLSASRNYGIHRAKGQLIALLDADDVWRPNKLSNQVSIFRQHPTIGMIAEASLYWYSWAAPTHEDILIPVGAQANTVYQPMELLLLLYPLGATAAPCPSGLMITRQACLAAGGFEESFTKKYQLYEDQAFLSKIYLREQVYVSGACNNLYRQRQGSIMQEAQVKGTYHSVRRYFLEWFKSYLNNIGFSDKLLNNALGKALFPYKYPALSFFKRFLSTPFSK